MQGSEGNSLGNFSDFYSATGDLRVSVEICKAFYRAIKCLQASGAGWCVESAGLSLEVGHGVP